MGDCVIYMCALIYVTYSILMITASIYEVLPHSVGLRPPQQNRREGGGGEEGGGRMWTVIFISGNHVSLALTLVLMAAVEVSTTSPQNKTYT